MVRRQIQKSFVVIKIGNSWYLDPMKFQSVVVTVEFWICEKRAGEFQYKAEMTGFFNCLEQGQKDPVNLVSYQV